MKKKTVRLEDILYEAELAFWGKVVKHMPQFNSGAYSEVESQIDKSMVLLARMKYHGESGLPSPKEDEFRDALEEGIKGWWWRHAVPSYDMELRDGTVLKSRPLLGHYKVDALGRIVRDEGD